MRSKKYAKFLKIILIICLALSINFSIETMMYAKDYEVFSNLQKINPEMAYGDYLNALIFNLFIKLINPIAISLYTFFTIDKYGINFFYKLFFGGMTLISIVNLFFEFSLHSVFYYLGLILNIILLIVILRQER